MGKNFLSPGEIADAIIYSSVKKVQLSTTKLVILGFLAGVFIAFASEGSNMAAFNLLANPETYGLGKTLAGLIFGTGLMLVVIAGAELFTGNTLIITGVLDKKITVRSMLRNWLLVYIGNFLGSVFIAFLIVQSGLFSGGANVLGGMTIKIAVYKTELSFIQAFYLGVMCNWLVCLAVWMAAGSKDIIGKIMAVFFPIWLFITSGFEHCIANMYYIPAGILAKASKTWAHAAVSLGVTYDNLTHLNWLSFVVNNLIPVTLGNIVGGCFFVGAINWYIYIKKKEVKKNRY